MCQNQLGKRNLSEAQKSYLIGKEYEAQKQTVGNHAERGNNGQYLKDQNEPLGGFENTAQKVAADVGVAEPTVKRAAQFVKGLDAAEAVSPGIKDAILTGEVKVTKAAVAAVAKLLISKDHFDLLIFYPLHVSFELRIPQKNACC